MDTSATGTAFPRRELTDGDDWAVRYVRSYLVLRMVVGVFGILLPVIMIMGEWLVLRGGVRVRGSLSAYYHSSMRDLFVATLAVTGVLLATYLAAEPRTREFWYSLIAGVAVLGVAFLPTERPGLLDGAARCGSTPMPSGCSPAQQQFGEETTATLHFACAAIFILSLARISSLFARDAARHRARGIAVVQRICSGIIVVAVVGVVAGELLDLELWRITPLYAGEVVSVWAFGISWLLASRDLTGRLAHPRP
ncbi:hypothetical protein [Plantactinospora sp. GCM10030261]|uniref:hypothetical protein n=1 Tax=Plantactinospora sp. GCM10030261 TaxID=3273420 RepID=UPI0036097F82